VSTFRNQADAAGIGTEVILVEQSDDDIEAERAATCQPDVLLRRPNRGYAAGLNAGTGAASGELLLLANPDVVFLDGSVGALADTVAHGADVAGPQLFGDRDGRVFLPIPDDPSPFAELRRILAQRRQTRRALCRVIQASWRVWAADQPCRVPSLRGPLLALRRDTFDRLGPLDEGYFLYYEETEWLWRARRTGATLVLAPGSKVVHNWGHSTRRHSDRAAIEARSRERFFRRNYPWPFRAVLRSLDSRAEESPGGFVEVDSPTLIPTTDADIWLSSLVHHMQPAMGSLTSSALLPELVRIVEVDRWYLVAAKRDSHRWRLRGRWTWERR
jgi:GT2 family glycosyltransferase